jgi:hypothetical protein
VIPVRPETALTPRPAEGKADQPAGERYASESPRAAFGPMQSSSSGGRLHHPVLSSTVPLAADSRRSNDGDLASVNVLGGG